MNKFFRRILLTIILITGSLIIQAQELKITNLKASSGKIYLVKYSSFNIDSLQYIDREYRFKEIPDFLIGKTLIMTAGNDKMFEEHEICFSFNVNKNVIIHVLYADKYPVLPKWLKKFKKTDKKVYRNDSSFETIKGIFTVYSKKYRKGNIKINGCLGKGIKTPEFVSNGGSGYCMFSVVVEEDVD